MFNRLYYSDITKRADVQNMLRILDQNQKKADTREASRSAIMGTSPEQQLASKEVNRRTYADALADIASEGNRIKDNYLNMYVNQRNNNYASRLGIMNTQLGLNNPDIAMHTNIANQWAAAGNNAMQAGMSGLSGVSFGTKQTGDKTTTDSTKTTTDSTTNTTDEVVTTTTTPTPADNGEATPKEKNKND